MLTPVVLPVSERVSLVVDLLGRKLVGSRAKTQAEMNVFFQGAFWNLAERYTDMVRREGARMRGLA